ncbi:cytokine receptor common subunit beta [Discoglossus pictus]
MGAPYRDGGLCILCALLCIQGVQGSEVLDSLKCTTDYNTHWRCEWRESEETHRVLPMSLYHWESLEKTRNQYVPSVLQTGGHDVRLSCRVNVSGFIRKMNASFSLLPQRSILLKAEITPAYKVQTPPPHGLIIQKSEDGQLILSWKAPIHMDPPLVLIYQISYRRMYWEEWEDAPLLTVVGELKLSVDSQPRVHGSTYLFRVRARIQEGQRFRGLWSKWSKELTWNVPEEDSTTPRNLQCVYDGLGELTCSWEVKAEVTLSVSYALYYTETHKETSTISGENPNTGEKMCDSTQNRSKAGDSYVMYSCTLQVPPTWAHSSFHVEVRPQEKVKTLIPCLNIQTQPPHNLRVEERPGRGYLLKWITEEIANNILITNQLCYWKEGDPECPPNSLLNVSGILTEYYIPSSKLEGSTKYSAYVRSKPVGIKPNDCFDGPWSDWSIKTSWKTKKDAHESSMFITAPISVLFLVILAYLGYKFIKRYKKRWEESLPNPSKSKLLSKFHLGVLTLSLPTNTNDEQHEEEPPIYFEQRQVDTLQLTDGEREEAVEERPQTSNGCPLGPYTRAPSANDKKECNLSTQALPGIDGPQDPLRVIITDTEAQHSTTCNAPYLMYNRARSLSDLCGKKIRDPGYVPLPTCQAEVLRQLCQTNEKVPSGNQMGYVVSMGAKPSSDPPTQPAKIGHQKQDSGYTPVPSPTDLQIFPDGPVLVITSDGTGPFMLKQVGDYCFFPGHRGSQERLEAKMESPSGQKMPPMLQDTPLPAVQAFKGMQGGYLALPATQDLASLVKLVTKTQSKNDTSGI